MLKIYWANSLFGKADPAFNDECVAKLHDAGHFVVNPQENSFNSTGEGVTAAEIFARDTGQITESDVIIASINKTITQSSFLGASARNILSWRASTHSP